MFAKLLERINSTSKDQVLSIPFLAIAFFIAADVLLLVLHFLFGQSLHIFNLDLERNLPTLYQGFKLAIIASVTAVCLYLVRYSGSDVKKSIKDFWLLIPYWFGFLYLAMDETAEIHENFAGVINRIGGDAVTNYREFFVARGYDSAQWLLFFIPVIIVALFYLAYLARYFFKKNHRGRALFIIAVVCFALVPVVELWNTAEFSYAYTFTQRNILIAFEEYLEMLGASLFFAFNMLWLKLLHSQHRAKER